MKFCGTLFRCLLLAAVPIASASVHSLDLRMRPDAGRRSAAAQPQQASASPATTNSRVPMSALSSCPIQSPAPTTTIRLPWSESTNFWISSIFRACSDAEKIKNYILAFGKDKENKEAA